MPQRRCETTIRGGAPGVPDEGPRALAPTCPEHALARDPGPVPHPRFRDHAPADTGRPRPRSTGDRRASGIMPSEGDGERVLRLLGDLRREGFVQRAGSRFGIAVGEGES